uniref:Uncharacterized protein n=1 Tax=Vitis vinifera TaxID=29760 RepID=A5B6G8_VITVI|nr:hypothetical protein VITISV_016338 [Vitis vinifera]
MAVLSMPRSFDRTHSEDRPCQSRHRHAVAAAERASRHLGGDEVSSPSAATARESQAEARSSCEGELQWIPIHHSQSQRFFQVHHPASLGRCQAP